MSKDMWELEANLFKHFSESSISQRLVFKLNCFPRLILLSQALKQQLKNHTDGCVADISARLADVVEVHVALTP